MPESLWQASAAFQSLSENLKSKIKNLSLNEHAAFYLSPSPLSRR